MRVDEGAAVGRGQGEAAGLGADVGVRWVGAGGRGATEVAGDGLLLEPLAGVAGVDAGPLGQLGEP